MKEYNWEAKCQEIYDAIVEHIREFGYPPTVRKLCEMTDVKSTSTMHRRLERLQQEGYISFVKGGSRTIVVNDFAPAVPVRCKECRYHHKTNMGIGVWCVCHKLNRKTDDDFWCAYGEVK